MKAFGIKKSLLTLVLVVVMSLAFVMGGLSLFNTARAEGEESVSVAPTFETVEGAWLRTHNEKDRLGIRFQIRMESSEYNKFVGQYSDVEFGMFVIPEDYRTSKGDFTEDNLFNAPKYYWGEVEEEYKVGKTEIMNYASTSMPVMEEDGETSYRTLNCTITNVKPTNATRPFTGVGYIKYNDGTGVKYVLDDNGSEFSLTIAELAKTALETGALSQEIADNLSDIVAIKQTAKVAVSINNVADQALTTAIAEEVNALEFAIGDTLDITDIANANIPDNCLLDLENSVLVQEIPAKGYASFIVNYTQIKSYAVVFNNWDGSLLASYEVEEGKTPEYLGETPVKAETASHTYTFTGWSPEISAVTADATYTAQFAENVKSFDVKFFVGSEQYGETQSVVYDGHATAPANPPAPLSKVFKCWSVGGVEVANLEEYFVTEATDFVAVFEWGFDVSSESTGNIAGYADLEGIVYSFATNRENNVFNYYDEKNGETIADSKLHFWTASNTENAIVFNSDFVKECFNAGYTVLKIVYSVNITTNVGGAIRVAKLNDSTFTDIGNTKDSLSTTQANKEVVIKIDTSSIDFDAGEKLAIGKVAAGDHNPLKITISHLEFQKPEDITKITGNIAGFAVQKEIITPKFNWSSRPNNNVLSDKNGETVVSVGTQGAAYLLFNSDFVKAQYERGNNMLKITFSFTTTINTNTRAGLYYYDASGTRKAFDNCKTNLLNIGTAYPETCIWEITPEMYEQIDLDNGGVLAIGNIACGEQNYSVMTISHLEFVDIWSTIDYSQNLVTSYNETIDIKSGKTGDNFVGDTSKNLFPSIYVNGGDNLSEIFAHTTGSGIKTICMNKYVYSQTKLIISKEYVQHAIEAGYTTVKVVLLEAPAGEITFHSSTDVSDNNNRANVAHTVDGLTYTIDVSNFTEDMYFIILKGGSAGRAFISEISFAKPAQA